jgi:glutaconate CoA-transferase subunit A
MATVTRRSKLMSVEQAADLVRDGDRVGLGGWIFYNTPMALVRALVRAGRRDLGLVPAPGSIGPDLLIGAGVVSRVHCVFITFEHLGLAPQFRRRAEDGTLSVLEMDGAGLAGGLRAAATDLPYMPIFDLGTDLPRVNPEWYRPLPPVGGRRFLAVPPLKLDVAFLHGQQADEHGNVQLLGGAFFDPLIALAARRVIVSVDRLVPNRVIRRAASRTKLPGYLVHGVVETPRGAHPTGSHALYDPDEARLREYLEASGDRSAFERYLDAYVRVDHARYCAALEGTEP